MSPAQTELRADPTAAIECHSVDDRFLPLRANDLIAAICQDAEKFGVDSEKLRAVADGLCDVIVQESAAFEMALADEYAMFSPDSDTHATAPLESTRTPEAYARVVRQLYYLFDKANFTQLNDIQIDDAIRTANSLGLRVRLCPERIEHMAIWVRGRGTLDRCVRSWRHPLRGVTHDVDVYRRIAVVARLRDDPHIIVKLFKDIPADAVEALLPHAEVRMGMFDQFMVFGGGAGALGGTATKAFGVISGAAALSSVLWALIIGLGTLAFRTVMGYRRTRTQRDSDRTRHLYFQNLSNNAGALHALVAMNAQEELKEAVLAYAFCLGRAEPPAHVRDIDQEIERYLAERFDARANFDVADAVETLSRLELWEDQARFRPLEPGAAARRLRRHWLRKRSIDYHQRRAERRSR